MGNSKDSVQLALLMQYTCYHMVIYVGLIAAFASNTLILPYYILIIAGVAFIPSCISTGIIAANLPFRFFIFLWHTVLACFATLN